MILNPNLFPAVILGLALYALGYRWATAFASRADRWQLGFLLLVISLPGFAIPIYYTHLLPDWPWYLEWRSWPYIEIAVALVGLPLGYYARAQTAGKWRIAPSLVLLVTLLLVFLPFSKSLLRPVRVANTSWVNHPELVWRQTTGSTCGPASLATIYRHFGVDRTEAQIAHAAFTSKSGTELWYLMRDARRHGLLVYAIEADSIRDVGMPSIIGVKLGRFGHFVTLLDSDGRQSVIGDPLEGQLTLTPAEFTARYPFTGTALIFARNPASPLQRIQPDPSHGCGPTCTTCPPPKAGKSTH